MLDKQSKGVYVRLVRRERSQMLIAIPTALWERAGLVVGGYCVLSELSDGSIRLAAWCDGVEGREGPGSAVDGDIGRSDAESSG